MSKEVKRFYIMPGSVPVLLSGDPAYTPMTNHLTDVHTVPLVPASDYEALLAERDALRDALTAMLEIHGVTQRYADTHIEIPQSWVDVSDFARAALQGEQP
ncbi:hypothetical protein [Stutzerimonas stutzeri]|uniref:Uncharacterized protein n=1 Tax=Stutzerimonas stutzeri KOS6 TaxID=1218352 RepID=A0A061JMK0_STUST|nr:hypothetical protein [Stutzerimonas stutzeri]EWC39595.1 hypothetical protein B597_019585 [Stutzerimonas stutzeri KOS6]